MRRRLIVVFCLAGVLVLLGAFAWSTRERPAATASWLAQAEASARHAGLEHVQCARDGSTIDCSATNGSAGYTIAGRQMNGRILVSTSAGGQISIDTVVPYRNP